MGGDNSSAPHAYCSKLLALDIRSLVAVSWYTSVVVMLIIVPLPACLAKVEYNVPLRFRIFEIHTFLIQVQQLTFSSVPVCTCCLCVCVCLSTRAMTLSFNTIGRMDSLFKN